MEFFIAIIIIVIIVCIAAIILAKSKKAIEEKENEEYINSTECSICREKSLGKKICDNCRKRSDVFVNELPKDKKSSYEKLINYRCDIKEKVINYETHPQREYLSIQLLAIDNILYDKYFDEKALQQDLDFLDEFFLCEYIATEEFKNKYLNNIKIPSSNENSESYKAINNNKIDYRKKHSTNYRCDDGHYVRSKSERDIDNFLFNNNILHIYESKYIDPITDKQYIPDFYLPQYKLYIEYFGLNSPEYNKKREEKIEAYKRNSAINFDYLDYTDDFNITEKMQYVCKKHNIPIKY